MLLCRVSWHPVSIVEYLKTFIYVSAITEARACHHQVDLEGHPQGQGHEHRLRGLDQRRKDIVAVSWIVRTDGPKRINLP